jgi:hypothetical protein
LASFTTLAATAAAIPARTPPSWLCGTGDTSLTSTHPLWGHAHDPLAGGQQRLLEPARDLPTVLDRPHALIIEPARPFDRGQVPRLVRVDLTMTANLARPSSTAESACVRLCVSVPITIICIVPSFGLTTDGADLRRTTSLGANATLLSGHAEGSSGGGERQS